MHYHGNDKAVVTRQNEVMDIDSTPTNASLDALARRLSSVREIMNAREFYGHVPQALSMYRPLTPPLFIWDPRLSDEELTLSGVHEMVHAVLHPPGSTLNVETPVEERIAHNVANRTCVYFGVESYPDFVDLWQLQPSHIEDDEQAGVALLLATVIETLETPDNPPAWLDRDTFSFGIESLELAWDEASSVNGSPEI